MYLHSSSGLGIFGMGVLLEEIAPEERRMIDRWLYDLDGSRPQAFYSSPQQRLRHPRFT
jgi:hypothetical protein